MVHDTKGEPNGSTQAEDLDIENIVFRSPFAYLNRAYAVTVPARAARRCPHLGRTTWADGFARYAAQLSINALRSSNRSPR